MNEKNILIVDDDRDIVDLIAEFIENIADFRYILKIDKALDGIIALEMMKNKKFNLVFIDQKMPYLKGEEVVSTIRNSEGANQNVPFVIVSGLLHDLDINKDEKDLKNIYYVQKPFSKIQLQRLVKLWLV